MKQRGRKSVAALAVAGAVELVPRLGPPSGLTQVERTRWLAIVNSRPADWFGDEHAPILLNYIRLLSTADKLAEQLAKFEPEWFEADAGPQRFAKLTSSYTNVVAGIKSLATAMRLTQQSVYGPRGASTAAGRVRGGPKPWHALEG